MFTMKNRLFGLVLLLGAVLAQAQTPNHQYRLDGSLADDMGGPTLVAAGGTLGATGYSFGVNQGLVMDPGLGGVYTIDLLFHLDSVATGWRKLVDFKALTSDNGLYTYAGQWDCCCTPRIGFGTVDAGVDVRLTLTRDAVGLASAYIKGALLATSVDGGIGDFAGNAARFFIDDVNTGQNEAGAGQVDHIRSFSTALSAAEVANLANPSNLPEPATAVLALLDLAVIGRKGWRRR